MTTSRGVTTSREVRLRAEPLWSRTGRGVSIAVIDSGAHPRHPHLGALADGVDLTRGTQRAPSPSAGADAHDLVDRLGHGTAVTAAIQAKAPGARIHPVRVFHEELATSAGALARAIDWAAERGCRLANLSLGTPRRSRTETLQPAVDRACERGMVVIAAYSHEGRRHYPGGLPGVLGVCLDWDLGRDSIRLARREGRRILYASGYPRPIPGVPPARNLNGISFAVANATGMVALALEHHTSARRRLEVLDTVAALAGASPPAQR